MRVVWLPLLASCLAFHQRQEPTIYEDGKQVRDFVNVHDVVEHHGHFAHAGDPDDANQHDRQRSEQPALRTLTEQFGGRPSFFHPEQKEITGMSNITESIDVEVPVRTAYDQWTQFEEFPKFMEGIEQVQQKDDTHLHWRASIGGTAHQEEPPCKLF